MKTTAKISRWLSPAQERKDAGERTGRLVLECIDQGLIDEFHCPLLYKEETLNRHVFLADEGPVVAGCVNSSWRSEAVVHLSHGFGAIGLGMVNPVLSMIPLVAAGPGTDSDCRQLIGVARAVPRSVKRQGRVTVPGR